MSDVKAPVAVGLSFRQMAPRDLLHVWRIEQQTSARRWTVQDFLTVLQSAHTVGQVAEVGDQIVGYVIYTVQTRQNDGDEDGTVVLREKGRTVRRDLADEPMHIVLLHLVVHPEWRRRGVGLALLNRLTKKLRRRDDNVQVTVPEGNLPAQLLLREAGFRAVRVLRSYFGDEDGYYLERVSG